METLLFILTLGSLLIFWTTIVIFYTPASFNLKTMIDDIDRNGELTKIKAPIIWYLTNSHTLICWTIGLPKTDKYLKYEIVKKTTKRLRLYRKIMAYTAPIAIICGALLMNIV